MDSQARRGSATPPIQSPEPLEFIVLSQKLDLEVDFTNRSLTGTTVLEIQPLTDDLCEIKINAWQCNIEEEGITVDGRTCEVRWEDQYKRRINISELVQTTVENYWAPQKEKVEELVTKSPEVGADLHIYLPADFVIRQANVEQLGALSNAASIAPAANLASEYLPIQVTIPFSVKDFRDGLHCAGFEDSQIHHVYTKQSLTGPGISCCIFPCFDNTLVKPQWNISIRCGRTLGNALIGEFGLDDEAKSLEMMVVCSGDVVNDVIDPADNTKKIVSFEIASNAVWAGHIAFAIGPFEHVDLTIHREDSTDSTLGQTPTKVNGYCLPGRSKEVHNAADSIPRAVDHFCRTYGSFPFTEYTMCFVGDQVQDTVDSASLTLCSERLLHPEEIIDELQPVARKLVYAVARQYVGVMILPEEVIDTWLTVGIPHFITDDYLKTLIGNNEHMSDLKRRTDRLLALDVNRPSLRSLGTVLWMGPFELEFMELKATMVLHALDRQIANNGKGSTGLNRVIARIITTANTADARTISTIHFESLCERFAHQSWRDFFVQWVQYAGYPRFVFTHRYDKKNQRIKIHIKQVQIFIPELNTTRKLEKSEFGREAQEEKHAIWAQPMPTTFTGKMTIRIYEPGGTPFDQRVTIDTTEKHLDINWNTKNKKMKRSQRQKERASAVSKAGSNLDGPDDLLLHCLGDVLQSRDEGEEWRLREWDQDDLVDMEAQPFDWITIDAHHEWPISTVDHTMEPYMYAAQLQQDHDIVAQFNALNHIAKCPPSPILSSVLVRTLMDSRYFHGIRAMAAETLPVHATEATDWIGKFHLQKAFVKQFCVAGTLSTPKPNNFADLQNYKIQTAIATAMSKIRDVGGHCPLDCQKFICDQLRLNDNSSNIFDDSHYVANLLKSLADAMIPVKATGDSIAVVEEMDDEAKEELQKFQQSAVDQIERYLKIDQTMGSWKNIYTTVALDSKKRLMQAKIIPTDFGGFLAYLQPDTLDIVQIEALNDVVDLGMLFGSEAMISFFVSVMTTAPSPFLRYQLSLVFWRGLASVAIGERLEKEPEGADDGLVIDQGQDQEESTARAAQIARSTNLSGALEALKKDLQDNQPLKTALWEGVKSPFIGLEEQWNLLEYCSVLYEPQFKCIIPLTIHARYYKVEYIGKGRLAFKKTARLRLKPIKDVYDKIAKEMTDAKELKAKQLKLSNLGSQLNGQAPAPPPPVTIGDMPAPARPTIFKPIPRPPSASGRVTLKRADSVSSTSTTASHSQFQSAVGQQRPIAKPSARLVILKLPSKRDFLNKLKEPAREKFREEERLKEQAQAKKQEQAKKRKASAEVLASESGLPSKRTLKLNVKPPSIASTPIRTTPAPHAPVGTPLPQSGVAERTPLPDGSGTKQRVPLPEGRKPPVSTTTSKKKSSKRVRPDEDDESPIPSKVIKLKIGSRNQELLEQFKR